MESSNDESSVYSDNELSKELNIRLSLKNGDYHIYLQDHVKIEIKQNKYNTTNKKAQRKSYNKERSIYLQDKETN